MKFSHKSCVALCASNSVRLLLWNSTSLPFWIVLWDIMKNTNVWYCGGLFRERGEHAQIRETWSFFSFFLWNVLCKGKTTSQIYSVWSKCVSRWMLLMLTLIQVWKLSEINPEHCWKTHGFFMQLHICMFVVLNGWQAKFKQKIELANTKAAVSAQERIVDDVKSASFPVLSSER